MDGTPEDTICAIATPTGEGGIGIIRISGAQALTVAQQVVRLRSGRSLASTPSYTLQLADVCVPKGSAATQVRTMLRMEVDVIDEGLVVVMRAPRSYTAEDIVELHCHGSAIVLGRVCQACLAAGARLAQPGEFTKRAFLNGRLDLSQAEAVLDTIRATSAAGLRIAQRQLRGQLGRQVDLLRTRLVTILAQVEAGIDFVDEDISFIDRDALVRALDETLAHIQAMLATANRGRVLREGARVVIVGRPNVGKSSLLNRLLEEERAIVTDVPGTTRDVLEEDVSFGALRLTLVDTAGLRDTTDTVEQEGIKRTEAALRQADVVLHMLDAGEIRDGAAAHALETGCDAKSVVVVNKMDLLDEPVAEMVLARAARMANQSVIPISVHAGRGIDALKAAIEVLLGQASLEATDGVVVTNIRHADALARAARCLQDALRAVRAHGTAECVAVDLRDASDALGEVTGAITSEDVLNSVFSTFCIGK
ncbi:MAG: tRNA uridine-5-carboxymethylaminomethyl(34) synthesis GTPase MnmE [Nitrospiraceae bacterium]|nr:tRNA uridine-5-carboxymethylaminomethyl(34) synthesis GTPase MnmE [Nitrospiraceae bacterium]